MKQFFDQDIHFVASEEELQLVRVAISAWMNVHQEFINTDENRKTSRAMVKLYEDVSKILESLPF